MTQVHVVHRRRIGRAALLTAALIATQWIASAAQNDDPGRQAAALVDRLGAGSHAERTDATRRLIKLGAAARPALERAATGGDYETALRARELLRLFDSLMFNGVTVELRADKSDLTWNDSVALEIRLHNESDANARVPFDLALNASRDESDARRRQVFALVDLADYLVVTGPDGEPIELRADGVEDDELLHAALNHRVERPPAQELKPGGEVIYRVEAFNRGLARYRLLEKGGYRVQLVYEPQWDDEEFRRARIAGVSSNPVTLTVTVPAPAIVRESSAPVSLTIERAGDAWVALLVNQDDLPALVNLNLTVEYAPPFARVNWFTACGDDAPVEIESAARSNRDQPDFSRDRIVMVAPGERVELARLTRDELPPSKAGSAAPEGAPCRLGVRYSNVTSLTWQRNDPRLFLNNPRAPEGLRNPLPHRMLVTTLSGETMLSTASE